MPTTKERLEAELKNQEQQKIQNIANANANEGAIQVLKMLIAEEEAKKEE